MKLLPKQEINKAKAQERKQEIDSGITLAKKVDALRETRVKEEENLKLWRESSIKKIQQEIEGYLEVKENLRKQTEEAESFRKQLIKPLDEEWLKVNIAKQQIEKEKEIIHKSKIFLSEQTEKLKLNSEEIAKITKKSKKNEEVTEKAKNEAIALRDMAQHEYEIAKSERDIQTKEHEKALSAANGLGKQYEAGIATNETKERINNEKESELIIREKELERRTINLQRTEQVLENQ